MEKEKAERGRDGAAMLLIFFLTVVFCFLALNTGHQWGDDFAAYMTDGIALDGGHYHEQIWTNGAIRNQDQPLVYVWAYSLVLAFVHRLVGFDLGNYSSIVYYKIPAMLFLAVWGILLYKVFRKRFNGIFALIMSLAISCSKWLVADVNNIQTDIQFAMLSWGCILLIEQFISPEQPENHRRQAWRGVFLGVLLYLTYITRYAGMLMVGVLLLAQFDKWIRTRQQKKSGAEDGEAAPVKGARGVTVSLLPYAVFILLYFVVGLMMPYAGTQASDIKKFGLDTLIANIKEYGFLTVKYFMALVPMGMNLPLKMKVAAAAPFALFALIGVIRSYKKECVLIAYFLVTIASLLMLPYTQGLRYMFNVLPCLILLISHGVQWLAKLAEGRSGLLARGLSWTVAAVVCIGLLGNTGMDVYQNLKAGRIMEGGAYTEDAISAYQFIRTQVPSDSKVYFTKARALSLNTGRQCINTYPVSPIRAKVGDYLLLSDDPELEYTREGDLNWINETGAVLSPVLELETLRLYQVIGMESAK